MLLVVLARAILKACPVMLPCVPLISTPANAVAISCTVDVEFTSANWQIATEAAVALAIASIPVRLPDMKLWSNEVVDVVADTVAVAVSRRALLTGVCTAHMQATKATAKHVFILSVAP